MAEDGIVTEHSGGFKRYQGTGTDLFDKDGTRCIMIVRDRGYPRRICRRRYSRNI